jgi:hypothetical protein
VTASWILAAMRKLASSKTSFRSATAITIVQTADLLGAAGRAIAAFAGSHVVAGCALGE